MDEDQTILVHQDACCLSIRDHKRYKDLLHHKQWSFDRLFQSHPLAENSADKNRDCSRILQESVNDFDRKLIQIDQRLLSA